MRVSAGLAMSETASQKFIPLSAKILVLRPLDSAAIPDHWNPEWPVGETWGVVRKRIEVGPGSSSVAFVDALSSKGWSISDVELVADGQGEGTYSYVFPRDVVWKTLPIVETPKIEHHFRGFSILSPKGFREPYVPRATDGILRLHGGLEAMIVDAPRLDDHCLWNAIGPVWDDLKERRLPVFWFDGRTLVEVETNTIEACASRMILQDRLVWSFTVNFTLMMSRAIAAVAVEDGWSRDYYRMIMPRIGGHSWTMFSPVGASILAGLRSFPLVSGSRESFGNPYEWWRELVRACPWVSEQSGSLSAFTWVGSGTYPALRFPTRSGDRGSSSIVHGAGDRVWLILSSLEASGLIALDGMGGMGLTPRGKRVLDLMGDAFADPDLLLRWEGAGLEEVRSVDRWLNKTFRAMKRKVAGLPTSPFLETSGGEALRKSEPNRKLVYGGVVWLGAAMEDPAVAAAVRSICAQQSKLPEAERRYGLRQDEKIVPSGPPKSLWYGVPVGTAKADEWKYGLRGWYCGLEDLDPEVRRIEDALPEVLKGRRDADRNWLLSAAATDDPVDCPMLEPRQSGVLRRASRRVMVGRVARVNGVSKRHPEIRQWIKVTGFRIPRFADSPGIEMQGSFKDDGDVAYVWEGLEAGLWDEAGEFWRPTSDERRFGRQVESRKRLTSNLFHDLSSRGGIEPEFGAWIVDGRSPPQPFSDDFTSRVIATMAAGT